MSKKYSDAERQVLVGLARLSGISDKQILRRIVTGVRGEWISLPAMIWSAT